MLKVSIALADSPRGRPIVDGRVKVEGVRLLPTVVHPSEMFWRQLRYGDFDVSEMSMSSLLIAASRGDHAWTALPVFTTRRFFHTWVMVRRGAGITSPQDLIGRRVGVPEYQQTAAVWSRGILEQYFGVRATEIEWFMERGPDRSHGASTGFSPPPGVRLNQIPPGQDIGGMLAAGELDATLLYLSDANLVDRARLPIGKVAEPLFPDAVAEGRRFHAETGLYPINHVVVVRRALLERYPWLALNLYGAFVRAQELLAKDAQYLIQAALETGRIAPDAAQALAHDVAPYGLSASRAELERIAAYLLQQGLISAPLDITAVFAPSTIDL